MEEIDYEPKLRKMKPPEGLASWARGQGGVGREFLLYKQEWVYDQDAKKKVQMVRVTCTACGHSFLSEKIQGCDCGRYGGPQFGWWNPLTTEEVASGSVTICPECLAPADAMHVTHISQFSSENVKVAELRRIKVKGYTDRLVIMNWLVQRDIWKDGHSEYSVLPWTAFVVEERKLVRLMGYTRWMNCLCPHPLEQRKTFLDYAGKAQLVYPVDPQILMGTTAENSKLDMFISQGGKYLVGYVALWRKKPQVENLVMQNYGVLVDELLGEEQPYFNYDRPRGIPKLDEIHWKEKRPNRMLGLGKAEFKAMAGKLDVSDFRKIRALRDNGVYLRLPNDLPLIKRFDRYSLEVIMKIAAPKDFQKTARYLLNQESDAATLRDYWSMAEKLQMDMNNGQIRWPDDLAMAHGKAVEQFHEVQDKVLAENFAQRAADLGRFAWERDGIIIRPCATEHELRMEGNTLHHCVATYAKRHAEGETAIFFVRKADEPDIPWFTLELDEKNFTVRQNRGKYNCARTEDVRDFENAWVAWLKKEFKKTKPRKKKGETAA